MKITNLKKNLMFLAVLTLALSAFGCSKAPSTGSTDQKDTTKSNSSVSSNYKSKYTGKKSVVTIEMEDGGVIKAELYPDIAPRTVDNFVDLIQKNIYNGLIFHRVIPEFMIQGGDPEGTGAGGSKVNIPGEFKNNGFKNDLKHTRGVLSMARSQEKNSASSQFFIMVKDSPNLDGDYAAFGKVTEGMDEVDKIVNVKRDEKDKPLTAQKMKKVTVEIK